MRSFSDCCIGGTWLSPTTWDHDLDSNPVAPNPRAEAVPLADILIGVPPDVCDRPSSEVPVAMLCGLLPGNQTRPLATA